MGYAQYLLLAAQAAIQTSISPHHQKLKASVVVDIGNATWLQYGDRWLREEDMPHSQNQWLC